MVQNCTFARFFAHIIAGLVLQADAKQLTEPSSSTPVATDVVIHHFANSRNSSSDFVRVSSVGTVERYVMRHKQRVQHALFQESGQRYSRQLTQDQVWALLHVFAS